MQGADHAQAERALPIHDLGNLALALEVRLQIGGLEFFLLHAEADGIDGIGSRDGEVLLLVFLDEQGPEFQLGLVGIGPVHQPFDVGQGGPMVAGGFEDFGFHRKSQIFVASILS